MSARGLLRLEARAGVKTCNSGNSGYIPKASLFLVIETVGQSACHYATIYAVIVVAGRKG